MNDEAKTLGYRGDRVRCNTADVVNRRIDQQTQANVQAYWGADPEAIEARIRELEQEWDIERVLEMNASAITLVGTSLGLKVNKRWFALPLVVMSFLFQHAIQGWCPPIPILRRLGIRTQREIEAEKYALKALQKMETSKNTQSASHLNVGMV